MNENVPVSKALYLQNVVYQLATHAISISVFVWLYQHLIATVSEAEFEIFVVTAPLVALIPVIGSFFTAGVRRYLLHAYARNDLDRMTQVVSTMVPVHLLLATSFLLIGGLMAWQIDTILVIRDPALISDARWIVFLLVLTIAISLGSGPLTSGLALQQNYLAINSILLLQQLIRNGLLLWLLLGVSSRVLWVPVSTVIAAAICSGITLFLSMRRVPALRVKRGFFRRSIIGELTSFGWWVFLQRSSGRFRRLAAPFILNRLATKFDVVSFGLGSIFTRQFQKLTGLVLDPMLAPIMAIYAKEDWGGLRLVYLRAGRFGLWLSLALTVPATIYATEFIRLYIPSKPHLHDTTVTVMQLLLLALPLRYANVLMGKLATAHAQMRPVALISMLTQGGAIALMVYLVVAHDMGAVGAALASLIVPLITRPLLAWPLGLRLARVTWRDWFLLTIVPGCLPGIAGGLAWWGLEVWLTPDSWVTLIGCTLGGFVVYGVVLVTLGFTQHERNDFRHAKNAALKLLMGRRPAG